MIWFVLLCIAFARCSCIDIGGCDAEKSRRVRKVIQDALLPLTGKVGFPSDCPLQEKRDLWKTYEQHKNKKRRSRWSCGYCGKTFRTESYLDLHMVHRHVNEANPDADVCLADWYDVLHVESYEKIMSYDHRYRSSPETYKICKRKESNERKEACKKLATLCYPNQGPPQANKMQQAFLEDVCMHHSCSSAGTPYSRIAPTRTIKRVLQRIGLVFSILGIFSFYAWTFMERWNAPPTRDLKRIQSKTDGSKKRSFSRFYELFFRDTKRKRKAC